MKKLLFQMSVDALTPHLDFYLAQAQPVIMIDFCDSLNQ
jgi:hypothetical protein